MRVVAIRQDGRGGLEVVGEKTIDWDDGPDATLVVPAFEPALGGHLEIHESLDAETVAWVSDYLEPILQETYSDEAERAVFVETFDSGYIMYELRVLSASEYRLQQANWYGHDHDRPELGEGCLYYEDAASTLWYNCIADEYDRELLPFLSNESPSVGHEEADGVEEPVRTVADWGAALLGLTALSVAIYRLIKRTG